MILLILLITSFHAVFSSEATVPFNTSTATLYGLVNTDYFVDKTDVVRALFQSPKSVVMVSAPRRFGKSVNMDIIRTFCEIIAYTNGTRVPRELTENYDLFKRNNLSITRNETFFNEHFGKYPTIYLDFKIVNYDTYRSFIESFKRLILATFLDHHYLFHSRKLDREDWLLFREFYEPDQVRRKGDKELYNFVVILSFLLHKHFNKTKCIILIDDFDAPVQKVMFKYGEISAKIVEIIFEFMSISLESNPYFKRVLINISTRLGPVLPGYDDKFILHHPFFINSNFSAFHGFTETEVKTLLQKHKMTDKFDEVKAFYHGYKIINRDSAVYSPLSIVSYLVSKQLKDYWIKSGDLELAERVFSRNVIQPKMRVLCSGNSTKILYLYRIYVNGILGLQRVIVKGGRLQNIDMFLQVMTDQGYFNVIHAKSIEPRNYHITDKERDSKVFIRIPNLEIRDFLCSKRNVSKQG